VEEAIRIKERLPGSKVIVVSLGPEDADSQIRTCLAMGADDAVHVVDPDFQRFDGEWRPPPLLAAVDQGPPPRSGPLRQAGS